MTREKTAEQVWNSCLEIVKDNVSPQNFKTWFDPIKPIKLNH
jgi:chromosomal replication initiator protein